MEAGHTWLLDCLSKTSRVQVTRAAQQEASPSPSDLGTGRISRLHLKESSSPPALEEAYLPLQVAVLAHTQGSGSCPGSVPFLDSLKRGQERWQLPEGQRTHAPLCQVLIIRESAAMVRLAMAAVATKRLVEVNRSSFQGGLVGGGGLGRFK